MTVIDASDPIRGHWNSTECQTACWGGVRLHPHNTPSIELFDYAVAAQCLLTPPSHPHKEQWDAVDVHTMIPWGLSNAQATEWSWEFTNHLPLGDVWRNELHIVLESFRSVNVTIDQRTGRATVSNA